MAILMGLSCGLIFLGYDIRVGVRIRAFDFVQVVVCAVFLWYALRRGLRSDTALFVLALGTYALCVACNAMLQTSLGTAVKESIQLLLFALFFLTFAHYINSPETTRRFLRVFLTTLWILALWNATYHVSHGSIAGWKDLGDQKLTHSFIVVIMTIMLFSPLRPHGIWWWGLFVLAIIFLVLSGERKGWIATLPAIIAAVMISNRGGVDVWALRRVLQLVTAFVVLGFLTVLLAPFVPYVEKQVASTGDFVRLLFSSYEARNATDTTLSNQGRLFGIEFAIQQFLAHPLFGIGLANYVRVVDGLNIDRALQKGAHNEILRIAAELGLAGLISYALIYLAMVARVVVMVRRMYLLDEYAQLRVRLGIGLMVYGFTANIFLAGGGLNLYLVLLPAAFLYSAPPPPPAGGIRTATSPSLP